MNLQVTQSVTNIDVFYLNDLNDFIVLSEKAYDVYTGQGDNTIIVLDQVKTRIHSQGSDTVYLIPAGIDTRTVEILNFTIGEDYIDLSSLTFPVSF